MAAFFRGFILLLFGALLGAGGILFFTPSFQVVVSRENSAVPLISLQVPGRAAVSPREATPVDPTPVVVEKPEPKLASGAPAPTIVMAEPELDFAAISRHLVVWPTAVATKAATTVEVMADGKKVQDLALEAGTVLQLSKVRADGQLEVRAKGVKFEIKSSLTDFAAEVTKRAAELVSKGATPTALMPAPVVVPPAPAVVVPPAPVVMSPAAPATLTDRVNLLFGRKPDGVVPVAPVAPTEVPAAVPKSAPAAPTPLPISPAPAPADPKVDPQAGEKAKDLDKKMNQLFR